MPNGHRLSTHKPRLTPLALCLATALSLGAGITQATEPRRDFASAFAAFQSAADVQAHPLFEPMGRKANARQRAFAQTPPDRPATTLVVENCNDSGPGSLREIVQTQAVSGDTVDLSQLSCSTITLTSGGAIYTDADDLALYGPGASYLSIDAGYSSGHSGSAIYHFGHGILNISHLTITDAKYTGTAVPTGGCIYSEGSVNLTGAIVSNCRILNSGDVESRGGGIYALDGLNVVSSRVEDNFVGGHLRAVGGGIFSGPDTVNVIDSTISGNTAAASADNPAGGIAGGIWAGGVYMFIDNSTISGNNASGDIGGVRGNRLYIANSTISGNVAGRVIGGVYGTANHVYYGTIAFNHAGTEVVGGVSFAAGIASGDSMGLSDTIVANNYSSYLAYYLRSDVSTSSGSAVSGSGNLILFSFVPVPPDTVELNPLLGPLADNGGPTQTHAIGFDSPAFDAGADDVGPVPYADDQRGEGYPRVVGGNPDIGAFEFQSAPAELVIAPGLLDFGSVGVGTVSGPMDVTLSNAGSGDLHVSAIDSAVVPFGGVGGSCGAPPFTLTPAASCTVTYTFAPIAAGAVGQNIFVMSNGGNGAFTLQGTGVGGTLAVVPDTLEFGAVGVGTVSAPMNVTLGNSGAGTLEVDVIDTAGAPFAEAGGTCGSPPFDLGPAASCTFAYTFAPTDPGDASQTLDVTSDGGDGAFTLHGAGVAGTLSIAPTTLEFGSVAVGDTAPTQSVTLSNSGAGTLEVDAIDAAGVPFAANGGICGSPPFDLGPAASCTLAYTFAPTDPGDASQTLDVTSNGGDGAFTLEGTGVQGTLGISPTTLDFGQVAVGDTTAAQSVTVSNLGTADVHVGAIDPASAPFAEAGGTCGEPPFTVAPAAVCTLDYVFAPSVVGAAFQTFEVTSDTGEGQFTLTGEGIPAEPQDRIFANGFDP